MAPAACDGKEEERHAVVHHLPFRHILCMHNAIMFLLLFYFLVKTQGLIYSKTDFFFGFLKNQYSTLQIFISRKHKKQKLFQKYLHVDHYNLSEHFSSSNNFTCHSKFTLLHANTHVTSNSMKQKPVAAIKYANNDYIILKSIALHT